MDRDALLRAIKHSNVAAHPENGVDGLLTKLEPLEKTGRYGKLVKSILSANDRSNFLAFVFESTFAYQFESVGRHLKYEVKQVGAASSSIDFLYKSECGMSVYFEARLIQQDSDTSQSVRDQLEKFCLYRASMDGEDEGREIRRLQGIILSKVQKEDGTPQKFTRAAEGIVNIVVVDVSDLILAAIDRVTDCRLARPAWSTLPSGA